MRKITKRVKSNECVSVSEITTAETISEDSYGDMTIANVHGLVIASRAYIHSDEVTELLMHYVNDSTATYFLLDRLFDRLFTEYRCWVASGHREDMLRMYINEMIDQRDSELHIRWWQEYIKQYYCAEITPMVQFQVNMEPSFIGNAQQTLQ
ncbi:hypothetical protein [Endozoicomonas sp. ONNA1]|uniref:hypothetical protein n=1 Tax=Endozoicomonas sp. ONNA1 TaxID=2828740 RepID=UPI0021486D55|nr:hypothetical protein [Endozoicomonas sp. ONNA1]